jgi:oxygen-independent coproporphyrinogen III oxidase
MQSLYVHFPFCEAKCHYCDFYSLGRERTRPGDADAFETALRKECERSGSRLAPELDTIFFGGGTPSMTPASSMRRALEPLRLGDRVTPRTEWTMEANPSSISVESMREYREFGVNRVSMGVQSMREDLLTKLGRVHSRDAAIRALNAVFEAGFENASVDLLCGVPDQGLEDLEEALSTLTAFPITHLSCYLLTLPKHHRMYRDLPNEDTQLAHLMLIDRWMKERGFEHYEISNYAKPGKEARHNLNYWKGSSYLGLGPSAHSFEAGEGKPGVRWKNVSSLHKYGQLLAAGESAVEWTEELTAEQKRLEDWMLALRLAEGFPENWLDTPTRRAHAGAFEREGLLETHPSLAGRLRLTARGFALSDQVISALA